MYLDTTVDPFVSRWYRREDGVFYTLSGGNDSRGSVWCLEF